MRKTPYLLGLLLIVFLIGTLPREVFRPGR